MEQLEPPRPRGFIAALQCLDRQVLSCFIREALAAVVGQEILEASDVGIDRIRVRSHLRRQVSSGWRWHAITFEVTADRFDDLR